MFGGLIGQFIEYWTHLRPPETQTDLVNLVAGILGILAIFFAVVRWTPTRAIAAGRWLAKNDARSQSGRVIQPQRLPSSTAALEVELVPSTGSGPKGIPDARITVRTGSTGGLFSVRGRIIDHQHDPNFVPSADYTLPWADAAGEHMNIPPHDERSVRVAETFDDYRQTGLTYFRLFAVANNSLTPTTVHHEVRWDPIHETVESLPQYLLEVRAYLRDSNLKPKIQTFRVQPASQRGPAKVERAT